MTSAHPPYLLISSRKFQPITSVQTAKQRQAALLNSDATWLRRLAARAAAVRSNLPGQGLNPLARAKPPCNPACVVRGKVYPHRRQTLNYLVVIHGFRDQGDRS
jgi:hypothetical protein